ncbi:hypothetical protein NLB96_00380 [Candidatus Aminicenantes bacterium AC-335-K20]|nr:hypothetical protein [Candidatus Aminicenantes bacterium AC-335-K20]
MKQSLGCAFNLPSSSGFEPTYEELKPKFLLHLSIVDNLDLSLPTRN